MQSRVKALEKTKPKSVITITNKNGSTWYRKYDDGFIVLGFNMKGTGKFTYPIPFKDTNYQIVTNCSSTIAKTTTSFSTDDVNYGVGYKQNPLSAVCFGY